MHSFKFKIVFSTYVIMDDSLLVRFQDDNLIFNGEPAQILVSFTKLDTGSYAISQFIPNSNEFIDLLNFGNMDSARLSCLELLFDDDIPSKLLDNI